jgi:5'-nucleotidase
MIGMRFLLTNDDGIDAPGLQALFDAASQLGDVIVAAPTAVHSGCGHRVTTDAPFAVEEVGAGRFAVAGTPADCVRVALHDLAPRVNWVLSGVNAGGNLGVDVYHSGTVAAVREAVLHGVPGVALSQYFRRDTTPDWRRATRWVLPLLRDLLAQPWAPGTFWNVNLPNLDAAAPDPRVVHCPLNPGPLPLSFRREGNFYRYNGDYHGRPRVAGSDVDVCFSGHIAATRLNVF